MYAHNDALPISPASISSQDSQINIASLTAATQLSKSEATASQSQLAEALQVAEKKIAELTQEKRLSEEHQRRTVYFQLDEEIRNLRGETKALQFQLQNTQLELDREKLQEQQNQALRQKVRSLQVEAHAQYEDYKSTYQRNETLQVFVADLLAQNKPVRPLQKANSPEGLLKLSEGKLLLYKNLHKQQIRELRALAKPEKTRWWKYALAGAGCLLGLVALTTGFGAAVGLPLLTLSLTTTSSIFLASGGSMILFSSIYFGFRNQLEEAETKNEFNNAFEKILDSPLSLEALEGEKLVEAYKLEEEPPLNRCAPAKFSKAEVPDRMDFQNASAKPNNFVDEAEILPGIVFSFEMGRSSPLQSVSLAKSSLYRRANDSTQDPLQAAADKPPAVNQEKRYN